MTKPVGEPNRFCHSFSIIIKLRITLTGGAQLRGYFHKDPPALSE